MTMTDAERREQLRKIGLDPDAPNLVTLPVRPEHKAKRSKEPTLAPEGVDPRTMPVSDIVFDAALLDGFPDLKGQRREAADYVFALYKSPGRNKDRHKLLWSEIGKFIVRVQRSRKSGVPHVKEQVRKTGDQRDLLALLAEMGVTSVEDMQALAARMKEDA